MMPVVGGVVLPSVKVKANVLIFPLVFGMSRVEAVRDVTDQLKSNGGAA